MRPALRYSPDCGSGAVLLALARITLWSLWKGVCWRANDWVWLAIGHLELVCVVGGFDLGRWAEAKLMGVLVDRIKCLGTCEVPVVDLRKSRL